MIKEIEIGQLNAIYEKYGDLGFEVETPYGYKNIDWCGITEKNADIYRCELENGMFVEGADLHKLKNDKGDFINLCEIEINEIVQTNTGNSKVTSIELLDIKDTLYDVQVADVHQYYTNGIVSHNTNLTVDTMKFLLFGNTTKTSINEQVFNTFSGKNELVVRGSITIEGDEDFIIERKLKRTAKKSGGWTVANVVNYYKVYPDGSEDDKPMNEEDATATTIKIRSVVGKEDDFELVVLATARNLDDLVDFTSGESGKLLTRFIGLDVISEKEKIVRKMYNEFSKQMKSNLYDVITLAEEITTHNDNLEILERLMSDLETKLISESGNLQDLKDTRTKLLESKQNVDAKISSLNPSMINEDIKIITARGITYKSKIESIVNEIIELGDVPFDEEKYESFRKENIELASIIAVKNATIKADNRMIVELEASGICQSCNRALDDVDNSSHIKKIRDKIELETKALTTQEKKLKKLTDDIADLDIIKSVVDKKNSLEIEKIKIEVEISGLRTELASKNSDLKAYKANLKTIEANKQIDVEVSLIDTKIVASELQVSEIKQKINRASYDIELNTNEIVKKEKLVIQIDKEKSAEAIFKIYINMVGQKGISKLVLRSVLPIINSELERLLDDVTDFDVEVTIDDKNEVRLLIVKDEVEKLLKSASGLERTTASLALRSVLGKISTLPTPVFIVFDEVLGRVAQENITYLKPLFDRIKDMYESVFFITFHSEVKDWADNVITVTKDENNISTINAN